MKITKSEYLRRKKIGSISDIAVELGITTADLTMRLMAVGLLYKNNEPSQVALARGYCQRGLGSDWLWKTELVTVLQDYDGLLVRLFGGIVLLEGWNTLPN